MKTKRWMVVLVLCLFVSATMLIAACDKPVLPESISIDGDATRSVDAGGTIAFTATVAPDTAQDKSVTWSIESGATAVGAAIDADGVFTAGDAAGTAIVVATSNAVPSLTAKVTVTVNEKNRPPVDDTVKVESITVTSSENATQVEQAGSLALTAAVLPDNATNKAVDWSIEPGAQASDATVSPQGVLTAGEAVGTVTVVATAADGSSVSGKLEITVTQAEYEVTFMGENSEVIGTQIVARGGSASEPQDLPVKLGQKAVWSASLTDIRQDTTLLLVRWEWLENYRVEFLDAAGNEISGAGVDCVGSQEGSDIRYPAESAYDKDGFLFTEWAVSVSGTVFTMTPQYVAAVRYTFFGQDGTTAVEGYADRKAPVSTKLGAIKPAMEDTDTHNFVGWALADDADKTVLADDHVIETDTDFVAVYQEAQRITFFAGDAEKELSLRFGVGYKGIAVNYPGLIRNGGNINEIYAAAIYTYDYFFDENSRRTDNPFDATNLSSASNAFAFIVGADGNIRVMYAVTEGILILNGQNEANKNYNFYLFEGKNSVENMIQPGEYVVVGVNGGALRAWADGKIWRSGKAAAALGTKVELTAVDLKALPVL